MKYVKNREVLLIITIYLFISITFIIKSNVLYTNIINPIFWICIFIYLIINIKKNYIRLKLNIKQLINITILSLIYILIYYYIGFILGFTKSPYSHEITALINNVYIKLIPILGIELTRGILIARNKNNKFVLIYVTIILILLEINYSNITNLISNKQELFEYICSSVITNISLGILYTFLCINGSFYLTIIYKLFKELVTILLPILPDIDWFLKGSICLISTLITYVYFKYNFFNKNKTRNIKRENTNSKIIYSITIIISVTLILFTIGSFKYESITILSNSMNPIFSRGDIVIYEKRSKENLESLNIGDIIVYSIGNQNITHRINDIIKDDKIYYQTKGDSNNVSDINLVSIDQIKGVYIFHIKYLGYPSVWLYNFFNN